MIPLRLYHSHNVREHICTEFKQLLHLRLFDSMCIGHLNFSLMISVLSFKLNPFQRLKFSNKYFLILSNIGGDLKGLSISGFLR